MQALLVAAPLVVVPALVTVRAPDGGAAVGRGARTGGPRWYERYWFKANLWLAIFGFVGNYFLSEYFSTSSA